MKFSSVLHHLNRIILVLEVFYDLHYCIIGRGSRGHYFFSRTKFSSEETFDSLSGFLKQQLLSTQYLEITKHVSFERY